MDGYKRQDAGSKQGVADRPAVIVAPGWGAPCSSRHSPPKKRSTGERPKVPPVFRLTTGEIASGRGAERDPRNVHGLSHHTLRHRILAGDLDPQQLWRPPSNGPRFVLTTGEPMSSSRAELDPRNVHGLLTNSLLKRLNKGGKWLDPEWLWSPSRWAK